jgi:hypothetical protein
MHATHFDHLVQSCAASATRRGVFRLLAILPLSGPGAFLAEESAAAKRHHRTTQHHHGARRDQLQEQRKKKKKKKCASAGQAVSKKRKSCCAGLVRDGSGVCGSATASAPSPLSPPPPAPGCTPATCAPNVCGSMADGCGGTLSCGGCAGTSLCLSTTCQVCDVCPSGCLFSSVQAAIDAASSGETIRICAGVYTEDLTIGQSLSLLGAGDGNGVGNTILRGSGTTVAVNILEVQSVALERLRITGGASNEFGAGIRTTADTLTLTDCTITGNRATGTSLDGGGIATFGNLELINTLVTGNTAGKRGGGIFSFFNTTVTLDAASRVAGNQASLTNSDNGGGIFNNGGAVRLSNADNVSGNTPDNCGGTVVPLCSS